MAAVPTTKVEVTPDMIFDSDDPDRVNKFRIWRKKVRNRIRTAGNADPLDYDLAKYLELHVGIDKSNALTPCISITTQRKQLG